MTVVDGHGEETRTVDNAVLMEVENLRRATLVALREKYQEVFQEETRSRHREHLFRRIAWRLQALAEGDLSERARGRAQRDRPGCRLANGCTARLLYRGWRARPDDAQGTGIAANRTAACHCRALCSRRKWKGRTILVEVLAKGFRYENRHYSSDTGDQTDNQPPAPDPLFSSRQ